MQRRTVLSSIVAVLLAPLVAFGKQVLPQVQQPAASPFRTPMPLFITGTHLPGVDGVEQLLLSIKGPPAQVKAFGDAYMAALPAHLRDTLLHDVAVVDNAKHVFLGIPAAYQLPVSPITLAAVIAIKKTACYGDHAVVYLCQRVNAMTRENLGYRTTL